MEMESEFTHRNETLYQAAQALYFYCIWAVCVFALNLQ